MDTMDPKERFYRQFQNSVANIQEQIRRLPSFAAVGGERQDAIEHILSGLSRLSNEVADAADYVPAYDQRTYSDLVKSLKDQVTEAQAKFTTKSRFQFKQRSAANAPGTAAKPDTRRLNPGAASTTDSSSKPSHEDTGTPSSLPSTSKDPNGGTDTDTTAAARDITLSDHRRVHITLPASASRATSTGTLTNLDRCVIDMSIPTSGSAAGAHPFASLMLKDIAGSAIVAGRVDGPVHVTNVRNSVILVVARQVRIHECENVTFYLHCVSRPIIEDCRGVRFARAPEGYLTDKEKDDTNLFDQVDDFKWLKATESPNWSVLPETEVIPESVWKKALVASPAVVVEDTLRTLGVGKEA